MNQCGNKVIVYGPCLHENNLLEMVLIFHVPSARAEGHILKIIIVHTEPQGTLKAL